MKIRIGVSNHHVHLTEDDYHILFGKEPLEKLRDLSQEGQYACHQTVSVKTEKSELSKLRIIGPFRSYTQVEVSLTDAYQLGIHPPTRDSGDLRDASTVTIIGPQGSVTRACAILATRHIHLSPWELATLGCDKEEEVSVKIPGPKGGTIDHVVFKVDPTYKMELHIDTDDGNAHQVKTGDEGEILR